MSNKKFWKRGQMAELARAVGIDPQNLSYILHRQRPCNKELAVKLENAAKRVLHRRISAMAWLFNDVTDHPAFFPKKSVKRSSTKAYNKKNRKHKIKRK